MFTSSFFSFVCSVPQICVFARGQRFGTCILRIQDQIDPVDMHTVDFFCKPLWTQDMRDESEAMDDQRPVGITQSHCFANAVAILRSRRMMNPLPL